MSVWNLPMAAWCVIGAVLMVLAYLVFLNLMRLNHWLGRGKKPRDRVAAFVVLGALLGAVGGGLWSSLLDDLRPCHMQSQPLGKCILKLS